MAISTISVSAKSITTPSSITDGWCSSDGWGSNSMGIGNWGMSVGYCWGSNGNWGGYGLNVKIRFSRDFGMDIGFSWDFGMDIGFSGDLFMYIRYSGDFLMYIRFSGNFLVDIRYGSWVNLSSIIVWVDE